MELGGCEYYSEGLRELSETLPIEGTSDVLTHLPEHRCSYPGYTRCVLADGKLCDLIKRGGMEVTEQKKLYELVLKEVRGDHLDNALEHVLDNYYVVNDFTTKEESGGSCMFYRGVLNQDLDEGPVIRTDDDFIGFLTGVRKASRLEPIIKISQDYGTALIDALDYIESFRLVSHLYYNSKSKYLEKAIKAIKNISEEYFDSVSTDVHSLGDRVIVATIPEQLGGYGGKHEYDIAIAPHFMILEFGEDGFSL